MLNLDTIMTTDPVTISPFSNLAAARRLMQEHRFHHLPVVDDDRQLVGLITLTDLLAATDSRLRGDDDSAGKIRASEIIVGDVMVRKVATVSSDASLRRAALFLEKHRIGCLPVVDDGRLVGIITDTDFVGVAINLLEQLEDNEPLYEAV